MHFDIAGEFNGEGYDSGEGMMPWRCYRTPAAGPCRKGDNANRQSWFFDVSTASCRVNPMTPVCDVTGDVIGNDFDTLDECISTCIPGEHGAALIYVSTAEWNGAERPPSYTYRKMLF